MLIGKVCGTVVSSTKHPSLDGLKLLAVQKIDPATFELTNDLNVVTDASEAGDGDIVICCHGSSARYTEGLEDHPVDDAVVGIVDSIFVADAMVYEKRDEK